MELFQEVLEDIIDKNNNLYIIEEKESFCIVANLSTKRIFSISDLDEESISIKEFYNYYMNTLYKNKIISTCDLEKALLDVSKTSALISVKYPPSIEDLAKEETLSLLGIFIQPGDFLETKYDKQIKNTHMKVYFYIKDEATNDKFFITTTTWCGMSPNGYTTCSYGEVDVIYPNYEVDMAKAMYTPREKMYISVIGDSFDASISVNNEKLVKVDYDGGSDDYPKGYMAFYLPNERLSKYFYFNERMDYYIKSLKPLNIDEISKLQALYKEKYLS